jgi:uncharacterized SAM-binding protein YcdF (DUF218 family)
MPFRAALSSFVLSPVFLVLLAYVALLLDRRRRRGFMLIAQICLLGLLVLSIPLIGSLMLIAIERDLPLAPPPDAPPGAIVILGGDIERDGAPAVPPTPGPSTLERILAGAALSRRTGLPILISGGPLHENEPSLATLMADSLQHDFQVPVRWTEPASRNTWENAQMSAAILREEHIGSVYVVTQAWHMRRAIMAFAAAGITMTAAPTRFDHIPTPLVTAFIPSARGWRDSYYALHEWIGCAFYALR